MRLPTLLTFVVIALVIHSVGISRIGLGTKKSNIVN